MTMMTQDEEIKVALRDDDVACLEKLLLGGVDPNARLAEGSLLGTACYYGSLGCVELLLSSGADVNFGGRMGRIPLFKTLKGSKAEHIKIMKLLIENGANIDAAYVTGNTPLLEAITLKDKDSSCNYYQKVMCLIRAGANVHLLNNNGDSCLHLAASRGRLNLVKELLKAGMDPNISQKRGIKHNKDTGITPLHYTAAVSSSVYDLSQTARVLIEAGANVNARKAGGPTPLHYAANYNALTVTDLLLAEGCEVDPLCEENMAAEGYSIWSTPLFLAVHRGFSKMVQKLVDAGANGEVQDKNGNTPLVHAALTYKVSVTRILIRAGCNVNVKQAGGSSIIVGILRSYANHVLTSHADGASFELLTMLVNAGIVLGVPEEIEFCAVMQRIEIALAMAVQESREWTVPHLQSTLEELKWLYQIGKTPSLKQISRLCIARTLKQNSHRPAVIFSVPLPTKLQECVAFHDI